MVDKRALLLQAREELVQGQWDEAESRYQELLHDDKADADGVLGMAKVELGRGAYAAAQSRIEQVLRQRPDDLDVQILHAVAIEGQGDAKAALARLQALADEHRSNVPAAFHTGRLLAASGEAELALGYLERAAAMADRAPERYAIENLMGYIHQEQGRLSEALQAHRRAVHISPQRVDAYLGLADAMQRGGDVDAALTLMDEALRQVGERSALLQKQAQLQLAKGQHAAAVRSAQRVCELEPKSVPAWLDLATASLNAHQWDTAEQAADKARQLAPLAWRPAFQLGLVYDATARPAEAEQAYRQALDREPDSWEPANNLGLLRLAQGDAEAALEAETFFRKALEQAGRPLIEPQLNLAIALSKQGKHAECVSLCDTLLDAQLPPRLRDKVAKVKAEAG